MQFVPGCDIDHLSYYEDFKDLFGGNVVAQAAVAGTGGTGQPRAATDKSNCVPKDKLRCFFAKVVAEQSNCSPACTQPLLLRRLFPPKPRQGATLAPEELFRKLCVTGHEDKLGKACAKITPPWPLEALREGMQPLQACGSSPPPPPAAFPRLPARPATGEGEGSLMHQMPQKVALAPPAPARERRGRRGQ